MYHASVFPWAIGHPLLSTLAQEVTVLTLAPYYLRGNFTGLLYRK